MATKRKLPKGLELWRSPRGVVNFHSVPMFRMHAWALLDYEHHNPGRLIVNSAIRDDKILRAFNRKYHTHLHSQLYLYDHQHEPGFFPANPPSLTSHAGHADGNVYYGRPGASLPKYKWGIDATDRPGGDAAHIVSWLNSHGYKAVRPYPTTSERHHLSFLRYPATNARKRLLGWTRGK